MDAVVVVIESPAVDLDFSFESQGETQTSTQRAPLVTPAPIVKAEANLLRFPFFALHTKGLRNCKGWSIRGKTNLDDGAYDFEYRITCNADDIFPGPLAREAHHALMHILTTTQVPPYANPVGFTWRQLRKAMGKTIGGADVRRLKEAIRSIHGTRIRSNYALKNAERKCLKSRERGYGLYTEYVFLDEVMPDKSVADMNYVWLADWFLANLNSFYSTELDYSLWQELQKQSPIASRLFEFLTFNFTGTWETFPINYAKLARFLPVTPKGHVSQAKEQLQPAINLLTQNEILLDAMWQQSKTGDIQLSFKRGPKLCGPQNKSANDERESIDAVHIKQLYKNQPAAQALVREFYRLWTGHDEHFISSRDCSLAREVLQQYGTALAEDLIPQVVSLMKNRWPDAKTFGATRRFWADANDKHEKRKRTADAKRQEFIDTEVQKAVKERDETQLEELRPAFAALPKNDQDDIRREVLASQPRSLTKFPKTLDRLCLRELEKRNAA